MVSCKLFCCCFGLSASLANRDLRSIIELLTCFRQVVQELDIDSGVRRCISNIPEINILPARGANVRDVMRHKHLIITQAGVTDLTNRLKRPLNRGFKPLGFDWKQLRDQRAAQTVLERGRRENLGSWITAKSPVVCRLH